MEAIVACCLQNGAIGCDGKIPWHLPSDLSFFKTTTCYCPQGYANAVIMGRRTWESIGGKPLKCRLNIVVSTTLQSLNIENVYVCSSLEAAKVLVESMPNIYKSFIIGGSKLYKDAIDMQLCNIIHVTLIHNFTCSDADAFFPFENMLQKYVEISASDLIQENGIVFSCHTYKLIERE